MNFYILPSPTAHRAKMSNFEAHCRAAAPNPGHHAVGIRKTLKIRVSVFYMKMTCFFGTVLVMAV